MLQLTIATNVISKVILTQLNEALNVQIVATVVNTDHKYADVVKRTCGYLGNPQARPMVHGRHKEISSRVKHMNGSAL